MSFDPISVGFIGAGGMARHHMRSARQIPDFVTAMVADLNVELAAAAAADEGCEYTGNVQELLDRPDIKAVVISTPNSTHYELGMAALRAGKHVLMEKPLALTGAQARELEAEAEARGLSLMGGHTQRFNENMIGPRDAIQAGEIGELRFLRIVGNGGWIWPGWQSWILNPEVSGGHAMHNGSHHADLANWLVGDFATTVHARGQKVTSAALGIYDYYMMAFQYPTGVTAVMEISRGEIPRDYTHVDFLAIGSKGVIQRSWNSPNFMEVSDRGFSLITPAPIAERTYIHELETFLRGVREPAVTEPPAAYAVSAVELTVAAEQSLASGKTIHVGGSK